MRWLAAGALLMIGFGMVGSAAAGGSQMSIFGLGLFGIASTLGAVILLAPETVPFATRPLTGFIDRLYFGDSWREPPPVDLKLAHIYRMEGNLEDAVWEYARARESHPANPQVLSEGILTLRALGRDAEAARWLRAGLRRVRDAEDRARLERSMTEPAVAPVERFF